MSTRYGIGFFWIFGLASLLLMAGPVLAGSLDYASVALHIGPSPAPPAAKACLPPNTGVQTDCQTWETRDALFTTGGMTRRYALVVTQAVDGVGGLSCGIEYSSNLFVGFDLCTDGLEFSNNGWPGSCGGNRITWTTCGRTLDPAYADRYSQTAGGLQVVFGSFYVYTYGGDGFFQVIKNPLSPGTEDDELAVGSCTAETSFLSYLAGGRIDIGNAGPGYNPCFLDPLLYSSSPAVSSSCNPAPVTPSTWGGVKARYVDPGEGRSQ